MMRGESEANSGTVSRRRPSGWRAIRVVALVLGLGFLVWVFLRTIEDPAVSFRNVSAGGFAIAVVVGLAANALVSVLLSDLVGKLAPGVPLLRRFGSYYLSQLAKYVPGRIAALLVQSATLDTRRSMTISLVTSIELMAIAVWTCSIAAVACTLIHASQDLYAAALLASGTVATAWLIRIDWRPAIRFGARLLRLSLDDSVLAASASPPWWRALLLAAGSIALPAASMYALVAQGFGESPERALALTAALLVSWVAGTLAVIFPAGIGVRELLFLGLGPYLSSGAAPEQMAAIALLSRLVQVLVDFLGAAGFLLWRSLQRKPS